MDTIMWKIILGIIIGMLLEGIYFSHSKGLVKLGSSWNLSKNKVYRFAHRIICETCPRRLYCERYKKEIKKQKT